jgi:hypothetical protein
MAMLGGSTTWKIEDPVHDERSIVLPADIGRR